MLSLKTILHPTDFSAYSRHAFRVACSLACAHGARLILLHVAPPLPVYYGEGVSIPMLAEISEEGVQDAMRNFVAADPDFAKLTSAIRLERGDPATEILCVARETACDLIVMGTHGRTGLRRLLMGSVAEEVVRKAPCPVVTVKKPFAHATTGLCQVAASSC